MNLSKANNRHVIEKGVKYIQNLHDEDTRMVVLVSVLLILNIFQTFF